MLILLILFTLEELVKLLEGRKSGTPVYSLALILLRVVMDLQQVMFTRLHAEGLELQQRAQRMGG